MKHVSTLFVFALMSSAFSIAFGQESCPNLFDSNSNGAVDIEDFLAVLSLFSDVDSDSDGIWDSQDACIDLEACNYAASPSEPCAYLDVLGACGGGCEGDGDSDGICDDVATSELGLGEGEWLFSRWTDGGVWQGGPTFGTQWDEIPAVILHASDGRLWMIG